MPPNSSPHTTQHQYTVQKASRTQIRHLELGDALSASRMKAVWEKTVRLGLRRQDVLDLHDYQDFHRSRQSVLQVLHAEVCSGAYRPKPSQVIRVEKTAGISRRVHLPTPEDAVLLQTLIEVLSPPRSETANNERLLHQNAHKATRPR
jgi:hypothetical protein